MEQYATLIDGLDEQNALLTAIATRTTTSSAGEAAALMQKHCIPSIVVTNDTGHPTGVVTERNTLQATQGKLPHVTKLGDIMSTPVVTVPASTTSLEAYQLCLSHGIRHLALVNDKNGIVGVASETDFRLRLNLTALAGHG